MPGRHDLVESGTHATFFGNATVNGVATTCRIDIDDNGEPGRARDTFKIQTASGYTVGGIITNGPIQVLTRTGAPCRAGCRAARATA
ncbi:MAG: hypothetical protein QOK36_2707 [Gaiellales bacterium]|jgi:hypothetical protein|nr:hypothetical protein [Gaiellales bacterium]